MNNNYIIIGDSISYGIGDFESGGWATMFKKYITSQDDSKVCNNFVHIACFPGATSTDILNRIDSIYNSFKHFEFNNIVILAVGINDTQEFNGNNNSSLEQYKSNIEKISKYVLEQNATLVILGITRIESDERFIWKPNKYYDNQVISKYDNDIQAILEFDKELNRFCLNNRIKYIPMQDVLEKEDYIDGLHPNHNGHIKMFERVKKYLNN